MMKKYDIVQNAKIINIIVAGLIFVTGLIILLLPGLSVTWEKTILGVLCVLIGGAKLIGYFSNDMYRLAFQFDLAIGLFILIMAVLIFISPERTIGMLPTIFGIYVMLDGLLKLQTAIDARQFGISRWMVIMLSAIVLCLIGVTVIVCSYVGIGTPSTMLGVALMADGAENIWITAYTVKVRAKKKHLSNKT